MKLLNDNRLWKVIAMAVPMLMVLVMFVPGSYIVQYEETIIGSYFRNEDTMIGMAWVMLMRAGFMIVLAFMGIRGKWNMSGWMLHFSVLLLFVMSMFLHFGSGSNWLVAVPPVLAALCPITTLLEWRSRSDLSDKQRESWRVKCNLIAALMNVLFLAGFWLENNRTDDLLNSPATAFVVASMILAAALIAVSAAGPLWFRTTGPVLLLGYTAELILLELIRSISGMYFRRMRHHYVFLIFCFMGALMSWIGGRKSKMANPAYHEMTKES